MDDIEALPITLTVSETAQQLRVSSRTVFNLIEEGKLHSIKVRGARRVTRQALLDYLHALEDAS